MVRSFTLYQAVEKRDPRRWASSFVIAAYWLYASFLRIHAPCISSFLTGLPAIRFINGLLRHSWERQVACRGASESLCETISR